MKMKKGTPRNTLPKQVGTLGARYVFTIVLLPQACQRSAFFTAKESHNKPVKSDQSMSSCLLLAQKSRQQTLAPYQGRSAYPLQRAGMPILREDDLIYA